MGYAENTSVSPEKSRAEIESCLKRYGAGAFGYMANDKSSAVMFQCSGKTIRIVIEMADIKNMPAPARHRWGWPTEIQKKTWIEQENRRRWRALLLVVKAKLEAVESKIATFDDEFMAYVVLPSGQTMAEWMRPQFAEMQASGRMPQLMLGSGV